MGRTSVLFAALVLVALSEHCTASSAATPQPSETRCANATYAVQDDLPDNSTVIWENSIIEGLHEVGILYKTADNHFYVEPFRNMSERLAGTLEVRKPPSRFERGPIQKFHGGLSSVRLQGCSGRMMQ
jgi:hypothetical protein